MSDILEEICNRKRDHVAKQKQRIPISDLEFAAQQADRPRGFYRALKEAKAEDRYGFICEIKKASPSKGLIRNDFHPADLAVAYENGGATCLSVLTDEPYFQGHDRYLMEARARVSLPVLRKDFMVDPYQIPESRALGADCILLIMAALDDVLADDLEAAATAYGMDCLIEVHDAEELERAHKLKSPLIGINNRNLKTMSVSLSTTLDLAGLVDRSRLLVAESGLARKDDLAQCAAVGASTFLIGETFMRQDDVAQAVTAFQKDTAHA